MSKQAEARLSEKIMMIMLKSGGWGFKVHGHGMQMAGIPDMLFSYQGRFVAIETKDDSPTTQQGNLSPIQNKRCKDIRMAGGIAITARTTDDVYAFIKGDYRFINFEIMYDKKAESYVTNGICTMGQYTSWISKLKVV